MAKSILNISFILFASLVLFSSCKPQETGSPLPVITFKSLVFAADTASLQLSFIDGDGDIGLTQNDTAGDFRYNCFVDLYKKTGSDWIKQEFILPYYYRIPVLNRGNKKILEGDIRLTLYDFPPDLGTPGVDTLKASVYIKDKALNASNTVFSQEFYSKN
ncbi:MAG: hypothetical protein RLZZ46_1082 [Bacteroidota bacterium]|jgi:hypothetical protein